MGLYNAFLNAIDNDIKELVHKSKRSYNVHNILEINPRTNMSVKYQNYPKIVHALWREHVGNKVTYSLKFLEAKIGT